MTLGAAMPFIDEIELEWADGEYLVEDVDLDSDGELIGVGRIYVHVGQWTELGLDQMGELLADDDFAKAVEDACEEYSCSAALWDWEDRMTRRAEQGWLDI